ncbi:unnamed protein product, partial [Ilex paraguariensis]
ELHMSISGSISLDYETFPKLFVLSQYDV